MQKDGFHRYSLVGILLLGTFWLISCIFVFWLGQFTNSWYKEHPGELMPPIYEAPFKPTDTQTIPPTLAPTHQLPPKKALSPRDVACAINNLNIRKWPGENFQRVGRFEKGKCVEVKGYNTDLTWVQIADGWVIASGVLLEKSQSTSALDAVKRLPDFNWSTPHQPSSLSAGMICDCSYNRYNCNDFSGYYEAQHCFDACVERGEGDIHWLDDDNDGIACEGLK